METKEDSGFNAFKCKKCGLRHNEGYDCEDGPMQDKCMNDKEDTDNEKMLKFEIQLLEDKLSFVKEQRKKIEETFFMQEGNLKEKLYFLKNMLGRIK